MIAVLHNLHFATLLGNVLISLKCALCNTNLCLARKFIAPISLVVVKFLLEICKFVYAIDVSK